MSNYDFTKRLIVFLKNIIFFSQTTSFEITKSNGQFILLIELTA
jgi:hypothetical protein